MKIVIPEYKPCEVPVFGDDREEVFEQWNRMAREVGYLGFAFAGDADFILLYGKAVSHPKWPSRRKAMLAFMKKYWGVMRRKRGEIDLARSSK